LSPVAVVNIPFSAVSCIGQLLRRNCCNVTQARNHLCPCCGVFLHVDGSSVSGLAVLVPLWLEHAPDMSGSLQTKHCAAALLELLKLRHHPALAGMTNATLTSTAHCCWFSSTSLRELGGQLLLQLYWLALAQTGVQV
jgi:hypothetical protein